MLFIIGCLIGIAMSAPVGGVNILCLRKSLRFGFKEGIIAASGAVAADALFAAIAIFGIGFISELIDQHAQIIQAVGGLAVMFFGWAIVRHDVDLDRGEDHRQSDPGGPISAFLITITNPGTVFGFIAFFSALGRFVPPPSDIAGSVMLLLGVVAGCVFWWCVVAGIASRFRHKVSGIMLSRINKFVGALLILFGTGILIRLGIVSL